MLICFNGRCCTQDCCYQQESKQIPYNRMLKYNVRTVPIFCIPLTTRVLRILIDGDGEAMRCWRLSRAGFNSLRPSEWLRGTAEKFPLCLIVLKMPLDITEFILEMRTFVMEGTPALFRFVPRVLWKNCSCPN
jgi:hypothetical protein